MTLNPLQIRLPFKPKGGDFSPNALKSSAEEVTLRFFDEVTVDPNDDDAIEANQETKQEPLVRRIFLGEVSFPVAGIFEAQEVKANFEVTRQDFL